MAKLSEPQQHALTVLGNQRSATVRVSNRTIAAGRGPDGAEPTIYWQAAASLRRLGLCTTHWNAGSEWARLTDEGKAAFTEGLES